jgi:putative transposase
VESPVSILRIILLLVRALFRDRSHLALENLALRQQLAILRHKAPRPRLRGADRAFWVSLEQVWDQWRSALILVKPETVIRWHRQGFRYFWRWKSRGRPCTSPELIRLIRRMSQENPLWGAPRIRSELLLLGYDVAEATVAKYMTRRSRRPPSQTWRTFLRNHLRTTVACDFFVVPTATFRLLFCFVILSHDRRRILHFNVTAHPTTAWTAQQIREVFSGDGTEPRYLLRDRDGVYGDAFRRVVRAIGIREILTAPQSPWQNPYAERVIGSIRRECLDHLIILGERHLRSILRDYVSYYNVSRPHLSLERNAPIPRSVEPSALGAVVAVPQVGGLHHLYTRAA